MAAAIKSKVTVPVLAVGRLDAELGEWILQNGMADLIGLNRRFFADPDYARKVSEGRLEDIAPCTACLECLSRQESASRSGAASTPPSVGDMTSPSSLRMPQRKSLLSAADRPAWRPPGWLP